MTARPISPWIATFLLVLVAVLPSANSLGAFFVGDDFDFLARMVRMDGAGETLRMSYWGEWEPLWYLGFYRDYSFWKLAPAGYHVANLFWLALGVVMLFRLLGELWPEARLAPWAAALLFATHPLHDEAVTYIAARGHPMSAALILVTLYCYVRWRRSKETGSLRWAWLAGGLVVALLAALAKETALILPLLIGEIEWCVFRGMRPTISSALRTIRATLPFIVPPALYLGLRYLAVGLASPKLRGPEDGLGQLFDSCARHIPEYALVGGLPFPFAFVDRELVRSLRSLGWVIAAAVFVPAAVAALAALKRDGRISRPLGIYLLGLSIVVIPLLPVFWADLDLRRRYFYMSSIGAAVAAAVVLEWLAARRARTAVVLTLALTLAGAIGLIQRNQLYRRSGEITLNLYETIRGAPRGRDSTRTRGEPKRVALVTLPRYLGGDSFSGAYLLHRTDVRSAFRLAGVEPRDFSAALKCYYADDYTAAVEFLSPDVLKLTISFRTRRAYESARGRDLKHDREGDRVEAILLSEDDAERVLTYEVTLARGFLGSEWNELYLYSDGRFRRINAPG
jgi:hypothetical protein